MSFMVSRLLAATLSVAAILVAVPAAAQMPGMGWPPAVGVARVEVKPITTRKEFVGRIQSVGRVALVARVTAFLEKQDFVEGAEVKAGDLLYELERPPFEADLQAKQAAVAQAEAQLDNAKLAFERAAALLKTPAGQQAAVDAARATMLTDVAQLRAAQAQAAESAINLDYTRIRAPIAGRIGRSAVTPGNVVSPGSGVLTTIVSQDPMYVVFPISTRDAIDLLHATPEGARAWRIRLRLPDGRDYSETGRLDFVDNSVAQTTDTLLLRGTIANPLPAGQSTGRPLVDGEFVTVLLEGVQPDRMPAIPRVAVMTDQQGDFVYTVDPQNRVGIARVKLGQVSGANVAVLSGLDPGQTVIVDGLQKVRPGQVVAPAPIANAADGAPAAALAASK